MQITVIDDDTSFRESLKSLIRSAGFETEGFASADAFLNSGSLNRSHCLIVDLRMPGISGLELQRRLNQLFRSVPIVFVSAYVNEETRKRALDAGAVDFLYKPFSDQRLMKAIEAALRRGDRSGAAPFGVLVPGERPLTD